MESERGGQSGQSGSAASGGLGGLLGSDALGSLAGALLGGKGGSGPGARAGAGGGDAGGLGGLLSALLAGGGSDLLGKLAGMMGGGDAPASQSGFSQAPSRSQAPVSASPEAQVMRMIRTLVYAAKADGHIDDQEQAAINQQLGKMNLGPEVHSMVQKAMDEQLDPARIANGVTDAREALRIYALSSAVSNPDNFMEKSYLDGLANALGIPANVRATVDGRVQGNG